MYLRTGANGTGKTLLTLRDVRAKQLAENRPVYWNGRFKLKPEKEAEFGWRRADVKDWETFEDGAIILVDECHNDMPVAAAMNNPPWITKLSEHRSRGFDFFLLTQHPSMLNKHVRGLIATPGWHQHLKRWPAGDLVAVCEWTEVCMQPERPGASQNTTNVPFPSEVYGWYDSAVLHTAKPRIPKKVLYGLGALVLIPGCIWYAVHSFSSNIDRKKQALGAPSGTGPVATGGGAGSPQAGAKLTVAEYVNSYTPRIAGIPHSAPRYDDVTKVTDAPAIAACISGASPRFKQATCRCYSQQGTVLDVLQDLCRQVVENGFFQDWQPPEKQSRGSAAEKPFAPALPRQTAPQVAQLDTPQGDADPGLQQPASTLRAVGSRGPAAAGQPPAAAPIRAASASLLR